MAFDLLSRRAKRVVKFSILIDFHGGSLAHRNVMPYAKEFVAGESNWTTPPLRSTTYVVRANRVTAGIVNLAKSLFFSEHMKQTVFLLSGRLKDGSCCKAYHKWTFWMIFPPLPQLAVGIVGPDRRSQKPDQLFSLLV